ncbi:branched-chain amino acid ABC transporter permease [Streptomyces himalayensis]|uniref:Branched-chain amino acid ABC transporter permease n=1 Tax=Streptomyces himalayensis subsp. himalayensis TaxID=2756131 RepID=A0A7W0DT81_9ACTN|nr:branched-chain amino acid ABC transporter permease [Streptomyces himalayensis]MBA2950828.1 branched-chain amino acid ABC transporter permease [Streptomyces himalayensis subsp. himalayensis]
MLVSSSLHLLVRTSGQVSLAHAALVAVGASTFSHLAVGAGLPWPVAVVLAGAVAVPVGVLVAVPAIRLSGLYLALATFGIGLLLEKVVYGSTWMFGATGTLPATRPALLAGDTAFYYVLLAAAVAGSLMVAAIGRSRLGRLLWAMADSPTMLSTLGLGLGVNVTRVTVFAISAFVAGIAGALHASQGQSAASVAVHVVRLADLAGDPGALLRPALGGSGGRRGGTGGRTGLHHQRDRRHVAARAVRARRARRGHPRWCSSAASGRGPGGGAARRRSGHRGPGGVAGRRAHRLGRSGRPAAQGRRHHGRAPRRAGTGAGPARRGLTREASR